MINRRDVLTGLCATCTGAAVAKAQPTYHGCTISTAEMTERIDVVNASNFYGAAPAPAVEGRLHGSGDATFDRALAVTLVKISETFSVLPGFAFSERIRLNAFASRRTELGRADGSVVFGNSMYRAIMLRREHPELGIVAICAHEFGHIVQYKHRIDDILVVNGRAKRLELHADFMAGYFAGRRKLEVPDFPAAVFATTQYSFGDGEYGDPDHHGCPAERGDAVVAGFDSAFRAKEGLAAALQTGVRYVQRIPLARRCA
jgi:hypothetical protein